MCVFRGEAAFVQYCALHNAHFFFFRLKVAFFGSAVQRTQLAKQTNNQSSSIGETDFLSLGAQQKVVKRTPKTPIRTTSRCLFPMRRWRSESPSSWMAW